MTEEERLDHCYECGGYGDDYHVDEDGNLVRNCESCPYFLLNNDEEDE